MKKITKRLVSVMLAFAIVLTGMVVPSDAKAATKGLYYGYDTYEDYVEGMGLGTGGVKVSPSDVSHRPLDETTEDGELIYGTYSELAKENGFVIPANCSKILVNVSGRPYMGYKADGTKVRIYDNDGYDVFGYDSKYNDRSGQNLKKILSNANKNTDTNTGNSNNNLDVEFYAAYHDDVNPHHYSSGAKVVYMFNRFTKKEQFKINYVEYTDGECDKRLSAKDYKVTVKTVAKSKDTVGIYDVTVKASKKYNNAKWSSRVIVIPQNNVFMSMLCPHTNPGYCYDHCKNTNETIIEANLYCNTVDKANQRETYHVEYKICKSTKTKTVKHNGEKYKVPVVNNKSDKVVKTGKVSLKNKDEKQIFKVGKKNKPGNWYYVKYRTYVVVDGEKIYSDWTIGNLYYSLGVITDEENVINDFNCYTYPELL